MQIGRETFCAWQLVAAWVQCSQSGVRALMSISNLVQNLVDSLPQTFDSPVPEELHGSLNSFVVYNRRRCVTSSAKRRRAPGSTMVSQTPDGSFLDLMRNAHDLLSRCGLSHVPEVRTVTTKCQMHAEQILPLGLAIAWLHHGKPDARPRFGPDVQHARPAEPLRPVPCP